MKLDIITHTFFNSSQFLFNLLCFGLVSANKYNKERVCLQYAAIAQQTRHYWNNIAPITF